MRFQSYQILKNVRFMTSMGKKGYQKKEVEEVLRKTYSQCFLGGNEGAHLAHARVKTLYIPTK